MDMAFDTLNLDSMATGTRMASASPYVGHQGSGVSAAPRFSNAASRTASPGPLEESKASSFNPTKNFVHNTSSYVIMCWDVLGA